MLTGHLCSTTTANLQESNATSAQPQVLSRVDRLRKKLQAAELEELSSVTTHGLCQGPSLGVITRSYSLRQHFQPGRTHCANLVGH